MSSKRPAGHTTFFASGIWCDALSKTRGVPAAELGKGNEGRAAHGGEQARG